MQLVGAAIFEVACVAGLPGLLHTTEEEAAWIYWPSVVGSACFTFSSTVFLLEASGSGGPPFALPEVLSLGYGVAALNMAGSLFFPVASVCYFATPATAQDWTGLEFAFSFWGVRFGFGTGSLCFAVGGLLGLIETLND